MSEKKVCSICGSDIIETKMNHDPDSIFTVCPTCGRFEITSHDPYLRGFDKNRLASFLYYNAFRNNDGLPVEYRYHTTLPKETCDEYTAEFNNGNNVHGHPVHMDGEIVNAWYPERFSDKVDRILLRLDEMTEYIGQEVELSLPELYSMMFVDRFRKNWNGSTEDRSEHEMNKQAFYMANYLSESDYVKCTPVISGNTTFGPISLTPAGYKRIDEFQKYSENGKNVLVAMKFGDETQKLREAIKQGIRDAGYNPILIDEVEHNELITPELLKHIKDSRFVVAELTHQNNGAYFEEGYAMGIGKPVIQICKKDIKLHFDIAQKNTIFWESEEDIPIRLANRIKATID